MQFHSKIGEGEQNALEKLRAAVKAKSKDKNHTDDFLLFRKKDSE